MNRQQLRTLEKIFEKPVRADIRWSEIESLFKALGAIIQKRSGSRIALKFKGLYLVIHKPHPGSELDKGAVGSIRSFLERVGIVL